MQPIFKEKDQYICTKQDFMGTLKLMGFLKWQSVGGRFGPPPLVSLLQPLTTSKWYRSTNFDIFGFDYFIMTPSGIDF